MIILGIESSCDETAAAVVKDGSLILSSVIASQIKTHSLYGGVVPELASRMHVEAIDTVVSQALEQAGITQDEIEGVAATQGPGLIGALLVGFSFARAFAWARQLPLAGVHHLEAHIYSLLLIENPPEFPFIALVVSGGHTNIYHVTSNHDFEIMGQTRDDAAGEAFDKVAKMLDLGYPGGPVIETLARTRPAKNQKKPAVKFPRTLLEKDSFDFSFSGLKSAVARYIHEANPVTPEEKAQVAEAFQTAVIDVLTTKLLRAARHKGCKQIGVAGGVSANQTFVKQLSDRAKDHGIKVFSPPLSLCGDNAAMIAARGFTMLRAGEICGPDEDVFSRDRR